MKKTAILLALLMLVAMSMMTVSAAGLDIPMVEYNGEMYYDLSGKDDYFKAARYGLDNRLTSVPVRFERSRFPEYETDRMWFNSVTSFDYTQDDLYYTYDRYSPSTVCMMPYHTDFINNVDHGQIEITYIDSAEELQKADAMLDAELAKVSTYSKKDKIRYVAEFICRTVDAGFQEMPGGGYDTINGVYDLMTGVRTNVVCSSFAFLFQRFMERAGYPCYIATGVNHAWNVVELDGKWYGVDCTYADEGATMNEQYFLMGMDRLKGYTSETENVFAEMETELGCRFAQLGYGVVPTTTTVRTTTTMVTTTARPTTTTTAKATVTTTKKSAVQTTPKTTATTTTAAATTATTVETTTTMTSEAPTTTTAETTVATTRPASDDTSAPNNGWIPWTAAGVVLCGGAAAAGVFFFKKK